MVVSLTLCVLCAWIIIKSVHVQTLLVTIMDERRRSLDVATLPKVNEFLSRSQLDSEFLLSDH